MKFIFERPILADIADVNYPPKTLGARTAPNDHEPDRFRSRFGRTAGRTRRTVRSGQPSAQVEGGFGHESFVCGSRTIARAGGARAADRPARRRGARLLGDTVAVRIPGLRISSSMPALRWSCFRRRDGRSAEAPSLTPERLARSAAPRRPQAAGRCSWSKSDGPDRAVDADPNGPAKQGDLIDSQPLRAPRRESRSGGTRGPAGPRRETPIAT